MADRLKTVFSHLKDGSGAVPQDVSSAAATMPALQQEFRYTVDGPKLSHEQRKFYEQNGFVVIKKLVPSDKLDRYRQRFEEICKREVKVQGLTIMRDVAIANSEFVPGEKAVTKIQNFQLDEELFGYCALPEVVEYVESFTGPDVVAMHTMLINKPPDSGKKTSRHPMHQDLYYFPFRPTDRIVCSWTAMQTINRDNGCLVVVPGSHITPGKLLHHGYPKWEGGVNKMYHGIQDWDPSSPRVHLHMEEGDTVFFHPLLIHGSGTNNTKGFRKSISCHYASGGCYYLDELEPEQKVIEEEITKLYQKKYGDLEMTMADGWKFKSRCVKGNDKLNE